MKSVVDDSLIQAHLVFQSKKVKTIVAVLELI